MNTFSRTRINWAFEWIIVEFKRSEEISMEFWWDKSSEALSVMIVKLFVDVELYYEIRSWNTSFGCATEVYGAKQTKYIVIPRLIRGTSNKLTQSTQFSEDVNGYTLDSIIAFRLSWKQLLIGRSTEKNVHLDSYSKSIFDRKEGKSYFSLIDCFLIF